MMYRSGPHPTPDVVGPTDWPPTLDENRKEQSFPPREPRRFWDDWSVGDWLNAVVWLLLGVGLAVVMLANLNGPW